MLDGVHFIETGVESDTVEVMSSSFTSPARELGTYSNSNDEDANCIYTCLFVNLS